ncbi:MAG TPA: hypothetical protein VFH15_06575 [Pyrinomonadaceae bacterium]|nr:hypothetical protein [Pyrinomonadaceae bacterium]
MNRTFPLLLTSALLLAISTATVAQSPQSIVTSVPVTSSSGISSTQDIRTALASLPVADTLVFINPRRIVNEVAPRLMSEKDLEGMRKTFADMNQFAGVDPTKVDFIVIAVRFRKPTADLKFVPPEFMALTSGDFNSESLMNLARTASEGKLREEKYGSKMLSLMTIDAIAKESEKNPFLKSFAEVGVVSLSANSIAVGTPNYLRAAIDAADGNGRISVESLNSLLRDPTVIASAAGSPMESFSKSFGILGTETNPRAPRWDSNLGNFYVALTMDATNFMLRGAVGADNPDTASIMNSLLSGFLRQAGSYMPDKSGQSVLNSLQLTAKDNEVVLSADLPQQMVIDFIRKHSQPKKEEASKAAATPAKKPVVRRKRRRPSQ